MLCKFKEAISCYEEALQINKDLNDKEVDGKILMNIGVIYKDLGEKYEKEAILYLQNSYHIFEGINSPNQEIVRKILESYGNRMTIHLSTNLNSPSSVPYFLWDEPMTVAKLKEKLNSVSVEERNRLLGKILREAMIRNVW